MLHRKIFATLLCVVSTLSVCLQAKADNQPPSIVNGIYASALSASSVRINWNKPWDDVGIEGYDIYRNGGYYNTVYQTQMLDENVASGSWYHYQVVAFDFSRNYSSQSAIASVLSKGVAPAPPAPENAPADINNSSGSDRPLTPSGLRVEVVNGNSVRLHWNTPDSSRSITGYNVHRDGQYLTWVSGNSFTESWIEWGKDFRYSVVAIDASERYSDRSDEVVANTNQNTSPKEQLQATASQASSVHNPRPAGNGLPEGYRMVFSEEFQGWSLDQSKWNTRYRWGAGWIINNERQYYVDRIKNPDFGYNPFSFDGEHLTISAIKTPDWLKHNANWQPYLSGALTTFNKFSMKYGFIEMRAKLPRGRGLWSAFWMLHQNDDQIRPEIDIVEYLGHQPNVLYNTYHWHEGWNGRSIPSLEVWGPDYSQEFHTYAVRWEPGLLIWYVDGVEKHRLPDANVSWENMYLLVNLAVGGWWPGDPDWATEFPARYTIDYIRAYQK